MAENMDGILLGVEIGVGLILLLVALAVGWSVLAWLVRTGFEVIEELGAVVRAIREDRALANIFLVFALIGFVGLFVYLSSLH